MITRLDIITQLYTDAAYVLENKGTYTAKDKDGKSIAIDIDKVNLEFYKQDYKNQREKLYPTWQEQMDMQYWDKINNTNVWIDTIAKIKNEERKS
tara:strand:- start:34 stop:318 length:285 start_codon:yes stop_codon:yes gene_type:complete